MDKNIYYKLAKIQKSNWFFKAKRDLIEKIFLKYKIKPKKSLDIGAGIGTNIQLLKKFSQKVQGVDNSKEAIKIARIEGIKNIYYGNALTFHKSKYDFILCSDIMEHVNDQKFLKNLHQITSKSGYVLITVPAFNFLWGNSDEIAHHQRRYSVKTLKELMLKHHFKITMINYWNFFTFLPAIFYLYLYEKIIAKAFNIKPKDNLFNIPKFLNQPLYWLMRIENWLCLKLRWPFGVDIVLLAKHLDE